MAHQKKLISSGAPWENIIGYSRAVKVGNLIEVSGTTAVNGEEIIGKGDMYAQAVFIFEKIEKILIETGSSMRDVILAQECMLPIFLNGKKQEKRMHFFLKK